jgi:hypothetical protein
MKQNGGGGQKYSEKTLSQCHSTNHMDSLKIEQPGRVTQGRALFETEMSLH